MIVLLIIMIILLFIGFASIERLIKENTEEIKKLNQTLQSALPYDPDEPVMRVQTGDGKWYDIKWGRSGL